MISTVLPCIAIGVLHLFMFLIPFDEGERISFGVTLMLSFSVFQVVLQGELPQTSEFIAIIGQLKTIFYISMIYYGKLKVSFIYPLSTASTSPSKIYVYVYFVIIEVYLSCVMYLTAVSLAGSIVIVNLHRRPNSRRIPRWLSFCVSKPGNINPWYYIWYSQLELTVNTIYN